MTLEEVVAALSWFVQTDRTIKGWLFLKKDYSGAISSKGFSIRRKIAYRNSFLPVSRGEFDLTPEGIRVRVRMTPHVFVIVFCGIFAASAFFIGPRPDSGNSILPEIALLLVVYLILLVAFHFEATRAEKFLRETLYP
jgi:hypothetical protein